MHSMALSWSSGFQMILFNMAFRFSIVNRKLQVTCMWCTWKYRYNHSSRAETDFSIIHLTLAADHCTCTWDIICVEWAQVKLEQIADLPPAFHQWQWVLLIYMISAFNMCAVDYSIEFATSMVRSFGTVLNYFIIRTRNLLVHLKISLIDDELL
jgi:hypothetical protein